MILDTITAISTAATALVAIVALIIAKQQLDSGRKISDESDAQESFREYLRVAIKYPDLAAGRPQAQEESRYRWFITYMLAALEKIQFSMEEDPEWQKTILETLSYHREYFRDPVRFTKLEFETYDKRMQALLKEHSEVGY